ncbi:hypothetical protein OS121_29725 [Mycolicibacterium mucogenicum]|uniref:hypothetical protein n=1 Tax=Mycolicibacterium mucogenicum TaxID=56689 RepID=UPI00226A6F17|nr:hypothetical protein [Mycolicibacterium mucogenicum]MCX8559229.1 hypothetical protein [Mycolicibacterium mucogenicum]
MTVDEALLRYDVTSAAWRLMLDAAYGQQIHRRAARRTLLAAGADLESATEWAELAADIARSARKKAKTAEPPPLPGSQKLLCVLTGANADRPRKRPGHGL